MLLKFANETEWLAQKEQDVTSTEVAALFGLNPYKSRRRLYHEKRGEVASDFEENPFTKWGRRLQIPVAMGICEDNGWHGFDLTHYYARNAALRLGASFDVKAVYDLNQARVLEVKIAEAFREEDGWLKDSAPLQYEFQMQCQLHLAMPEDREIKSGVIGTLGKRQSTRLYFREYDDGVGALINEETEKFWKEVEEGNAPDPDYALDADLLDKLRGPIRNGDVVNLSSNARALELSARYAAGSHTLKAAKEILKPAEKELREIKAELHEMIGRNETAVIGEFQIGARRQVREENVNYETSFRRFDFKRREI